jgi:hypothetical protein
VTPASLEGLVRRAETAVRRGQELLSAVGATPGVIRRDLEEDFSFGYALQLFLEAVRRLWKASQRVHRPPSEMVALARAWAKGAGERRGRPKKNAKLVRRRARFSQKGKTRELAARAAGFSSAEAYRAAARVVDSGRRELIEGMDAGRLRIRTAARLAREAAG